MVTVIVQHKVADFTEWKEIFAADESGCSVAGVALEGLYTSVKKANDVTMIFTAPEAEVFDALMQVPERQMLMQQAGVISAPKAWILNTV